MPWTYRVLAGAVGIVWPLLILAGGLAAATGHRFGAYLTVIALTALSTMKRLLPLVLRRGSARSIWPGARVPEHNPRLAYAALWILMLAGLYTAMLGHRLGAWILLLGFLGQLALDLTVALVGYTDVMSRPWPKVAPLDDDDDW